MAFIEFVLAFIVQQLGLQILYYRVGDRNYVQELRYIVQDFKSCGPAGLSGMFEFKG